MGNFLIPTLIAVGWLGWLLQLPDSVLDWHNSLKVYGKIEQHVKVGGCRDFGNLLVDHYVIPGPKGLLSAATTWRSYFDTMPCHEALFVTPQH